MRKGKVKGRVKRRSRLHWLTRFPWWLCFAAGGAAWFYLQDLSAVHPAAVRVQKLADIQPAVSRWAPWAAAYVGQYVVPGFFGMTGLASLWRRWRNRRLMRRALGNPRSLASGMDWREFEHLVAEIFRRKGYSVSMTENSADGGVDVVLYRRGTRSFVQCKQWRSAKVGVGVVRELYGVMAAEGVEEGFVVTCGTFTEAAKDFAHGLNIHLIDYYDLCEWMGVSPYGR